MEKQLVGHRDFVVSYSGWHAAERDDDETTTTIFGRGSPPHTFAHGKHKPFG